MGNEERRSARDASREAAAEAKASKARAKAMRPWFKKKRFVLPLALLLIVIIGVVAGGGSDDTGTTETAAAGDSSDGPRTRSGNETNPPEADVEIARCYAEALFDHLEAEVEITNNSSEPSDYLGEVVFESENGSEQFDSSHFSASSVEPGQSTTVQVMTATEASGPFTCRIAEVDRFAAS